MAFAALSAIAAGDDVFVVTDAQGIFNPITRDTASSGELHRDWRNDVEGLGTLFANHIPDYRNLMASYSAFKSAK